MHVLRFVLPPTLAAFVAPGPHGCGITIGFNDLVFASGPDPEHCCRLAAGFLDEIGARRLPRTIAASLIKLLPYSAHSLPTETDVEALHDRVSRFAASARPISIDVSATAVSFTGRGRRAITIDCAEPRARGEAQGHRVPRALPPGSKPSPA